MTKNVHKNCDKLAGKLYTNEFGEARGVRAELWKGSKWRVPLSTRVRTISGSSSPRSVAKIIIPLGHFPFCARNGAHT